MRKLVTFARGLKRNTAAVKAAFSQPPSNGVLEGNVNRLKMIKRTMYGPGSLALLRAPSNHSVGPHRQQSGSDQSELPTEL